MPIFISYSQKDKNFVENLAFNLVQKKHHIWMDKWELKVGDSLIDKIQNILTESSAVLIILSKNSLESQWCKKELNSTLSREIEEKKSLLIPCVIDDCKIPLFLKEKLYADFRSNPDKALEDVDRALAAISNPFQGRIESPKFFTDWSVDWKKIEGSWIIEWSFVDHGHEYPYVVLSQCLIFCNEVASQNFTLAEAKGKREFFFHDLVELIISQIEDNELSFIMDSAFEVDLSKEFIGKNGQEYSVRFSCRRMGIDNGMDTLMHLDNNLRQALQHMKTVLHEPEGSS